MPKAKDIFNFDNPVYSVLREPSRQVIKAYQDANRFFDTTQEYVYIEEGMPNLAQIIHKQAHEFPKRFDKFGDMMHERHLLIEYPETPELNWREELKDLDSVFDLLIKVFDNIQEALEKFYKVTDNEKFRPMALFAEEMMLENSKDYTKFLEIWFRWNNDGGSKTSFDSWCKHLFCDGE